MPSHAGARSPLRIAFLPPFASEDVRGQTHALFDGGLAPACEFPPVRDGLFGALTAAVVASLRTALRHLRQG